MILRRISKDLLIESPYEEWNAFIDLIAMEEYEDLNQIQRIAHLCFWYDSEVQNGGHIQYFENKGTEKVNETINALKSLGASKQADILGEAYRQYSLKIRKTINTVLGFVMASREGEYERFDNQYYDCEPNVTELLEKYFVANKEHFVELV
ncbi:DMP19 family protein [Paenibacillus sedimenti]|uniref:DUF4375 domain-containing protein n=1 Tax=Paenibacillus sedimenti TaxID=2770274 RepID=A0A926QNU3_9BACL|nr:DUF4375 domain-containing protein [Paenibacillus sedimenti]MBD0384714.1 DUF4375 domain-containing protein [Paenibacillus sedimenti]